jgi:GNAT superfamily N-acetyltransferase
LVFDFLVADKSELIDWLRINHAIYPWIFFEKEIESATKNNHVYMVVKHKKSIIGYIKVGVGKTYIHDFNMEICFPERTAFIYDTFVLPDMRGKNVAVHALFSLMEYLNARGFCRILCHIEDWNKASVRTFEKAYFYPRGSVRFIRVAECSIYIRGRFRFYRTLESYVTE